MGARPARPVWMEAPALGTTISKIVILAVIVVVMAFPFVYVLSVSLSSPRDLLSGNLSLIPAHPTLQSYRAVLAGGVVTRALEVSVVITVVGTLVSMLMTTTLAYGLTRTGQVPGSKFVLLLVLGTLLFSAGIIPNYLVVRYLGLLNTYASLILPGMISAFNLVVVRQFFMNIPSELVDAALIDGAGPFRIFRHVMLPLSRAVLAVVALFYGVALWSDYFNALLYLSDSSMWPIQLVLRLYLLQGHNPTDMAAVVIATVPILLVYPFLQRYFTQGVLSGAIRG